MKNRAFRPVRRALLATGLAVGAALLGFLLVRGEDPMQSLLFEEQPEVIVGLTLFLLGRLFLLFVAPGWLLYCLIGAWFTKRVAAKIDRA